MLIYVSLLMMTIAIELSVARLLLKVDKAGPNLREVLMVVLGMNLITHPLAWGAFVLLNTNWIVVESVVVFIEAIAMLSLTGRNMMLAAGLSFTMNAASMAAGLAIDTIR